MSSVTCCWRQTLLDDQPFQSLDLFGRKPLQVLIHHIDAGHCPTLQQVDQRVGGKRFDAIHTSRSQCGCIDEQSQHADM